MKNIMPINQHIQMRRTDGANAFWCMFGNIHQNEEGEFYYTEYTMENPRSVKVDDLPEECKKVILKLLKEQNCITT